MYQEEDQEADQDHHGSVAQANNYLFRAARDQDQIRNMVVNVCYLCLKYCINCKAFDFPQMEHVYL